MKPHILIGCFAYALGLTTWAHAQAVPTASRTSSIQIGAGVTYARPDYSSPIKGITVYGSYDFSKYLGVEGDIHLVNLITPADIGETTYLLGPRFRYRYRRFTPYAKALFGLGQFQYQYPSNWGKASTSTYGVYSFGGGVDLRATRHLNIRAFDFEYQKWPGFQPNGLSPLVMTIGAAYSFR